MGNRRLKFILVLFMALWVMTGEAQKINPGFLGKKFALGYNRQFAPVMLVEANLNNFTRNNFYIEYAISQRQSLTANIAHKKVNVAYSESEDYYYDELDEEYSLGNQRYTVYRNRTGGSADFRSLAFGLKYNYYNRRKSVAAPAGFCQYVRIDFIRDKALNNNFKYEIRNDPPLTPEQEKNAKIPEVENTTCTALSVGFGMESKKMLTRSVFISFHWEINMNTNTLLLLYDYYFDDKGVNGQLKGIARDLDSYKNILLGGFGLGILL